MCLDGSKPLHVQPELQPRMEVVGVNILPAVAAFFKVCPVCLVCGSPRMLQDFSKGPVFLKLQKKNSSLLNDDKNENMDFL